MNTYFIADVFAEEKYAGNPLAVVLNAGNLSARQMQQIAREFNFSETTFVLADHPGDNGYDVRIFTPTAEVPFAGHPTIGTAFVIQEILEHWRQDTLTLNLKAGPIPTIRTLADNQDRILWLKALQPQFGACFTLEEFAPILNLAPEDFDPRFPVQAVSTGLPFILIPLKNLNAAKQARMQMDPFRQFLAKHNTAQAVFLFCPETENSKNHLHGRMFGDLYGVPEDPATGSANACLGGYLVKYRYFGESIIDIRVEQGYEIARPSLIYLQARSEGCCFNIAVGGKVFIVASGNLM